MQSCLAYRISMEKSLDQFSQLKKRHLVGEDRISLLPDDILLIILSSLTLKDMSKTNILSSRWLNLWLNTSLLDFQGPVYRLKIFDVPCNIQRFCADNTNFVKWVSHVIQQHKGNSLKEFRIGMNHIIESHQKDIDKWLEYALASKVEILELNFFVSGASVPARTPLNYVLDHTRFLQYELICLKSLSLRHVNVDAQAIDLLLLKCLFLERLEVVWSRTLVGLVISDPNLALKYLHIEYCFNLEVLSISNFNLLSLHVSSHDSLRDLTLKRLPMLVELSISGLSNNFRLILSQITTCLPQLEAFTLAPNYLTQVSELSDLLQLTKLKRLLIHVPVEFDDRLIALFSTVKSCLHLEEFVLEMEWWDPKRSSRGIREVERLSNKNKSIKVFEFNGYYGRVSDVEFVMHVVENATGLEKIVINTHNYVERLYGKGPGHSSEEEARSFALKQLEYLRESKYIPSHVDVFIC